MRFDRERDVRPAFEMRLLQNFFARRKHVRSEQRLKFTRHIGNRTIHFLVLRHHAPVGQTRLSFQSREFVTDVDELNLTGKCLQQLHDDCFVFDRIHRTRRVNHQTARSQKLNSARCNSKLQRMQTEGVSRIPFFPQVGILSQRSVARTRNITEDSIERNRFVLN